MTRSTLTARRFAEALAAHNADAALATAHPQIELRLPCTILRGHSGLRQLLARALLEDEQEIVVGDVIKTPTRSWCSGASTTSASAPLSTYATTARAS